MLFFTILCVQLSDFWTVFAIPIIITILGAFLGAWLGFWFANRKASEDFMEERNDILRALLYTLKENLQYIEQIKTVHFPASQFPSFPLDTVALAYVSLSARRYLPRGTNWSQRYNKLRFELDHINRKILMNFMHPPASIGGLMALIDNAEAMLAEEIKLLELRFEN